MSPIRERTARATHKKVSLQKRFSNISRRQSIKSSSEASLCSLLPVAEHSVEVSAPAATVTKQLLDFNSEHPSKSVAINPYRKKTDKKLSKTFINMLQSPPGTLILGARQHIKTLFPVSQTTPCFESGGHTNIVICGDAADKEFYDDEKWNTERGLMALHLLLLNKWKPLFLNKTNELKEKADINDFVVGKWSMKEIELLLILGGEFTLKEANEHIPASHIEWYFPEPIPSDKLDLKTIAGFNLNRTEFLFSEKELSVLKEYGFTQKENYFVFDPNYFNPDNKAILERQLRQAHSVKIDAAKKGDGTMIHQTASMNGINLFSSFPFPCIPNGNVVNFYAAPSPDEYKKEEAAATEPKIISNHEMKIELKKTLKQLSIAKYLLEISTTPRSISLKQKKTLYRKINEKPLNVTIIENFNFNDREILIEMFQYVPDINKELVKIITNKLNENKDEKISPDNDETLHNLCELYGNLRLTTEKGEGSSSTTTGCEPPFIPSAQREESSSTSEERNAAEAPPKSSTEAIAGGNSVASSSTEVPAGRYSVASSSTEATAGRYSVASSSTEVPAGRYSVASSSTEVPEERNSVASSSTEVPEERNSVVSLAPLVPSEKAAAAADQNAAETLKIEIEEMVFKKLEKEGAPYWRHMEETNLRKNIRNWISQTEKTEKNDFVAKLTKSRLSSSAAVIAEKKRLQLVAAQPESTVVTTEVNSNKEIQQLLGQKKGIRAAAGQPAAIAKIVEINKKIQQLLDQKKDIRGKKKANSTSPYKNQDVPLAEVKNDGLALNAPPKLQTDPEVVAAAVAQHGQAAQFASTP